MPKQKIRIKLKGFDHKLVDQAAVQIGRLSYGQNPLA